MRTSRDDQFLAAVSSQGIGGQPDQLIAYAHTMCDVVGTPAALGPMTNLMATQGLSPQQAATVMIDGLRVYCPEKSGLIPPIAAPGPLKESNRAPTPVEKGISMGPPAGFEPTAFCSGGS